MAEEAEIAAAWKIFSHDGRVRWFAKDKHRRYGGWIGSAVQLGRAVDVATALGRDFYLQANICRPDFHGIKCRTADITHWRMLVEDYDPCAGQHPMDPPPAIRHSRHKAICFSGRGWQLWTRMEPKRVEDAGACERGMANWLRNPRRATYPQEGWVLDTTCSDLARVVRCPGSVNTKTGCMARVANMGEIIAAHGMILAQAGPEPAPVVPVEGVESGNLLGAIVHLNGTSRGFLLSGTSTPGRHSRAFSTAKNLSEIGATREQAERWVRLGAQRCQPPLPPGDVQRIIKQVYE